MELESETLSDASSFLLDVLRLGAALLVVVAHLSRPEFRVVTSRDLKFLGDFAVPVFFVLSGFVIRYVTVTREHTLRGYLIDRGARIYSVALPAMALTLLVTALVYATNGRYATEVLAPLMHHPGTRVLANLLFLGQIWGLNTVQFGNTPFWSLSYECLFYLGYGLLFYLHGARRIVAVVIWAAVAGPPTLLLFLLWLLGCGLFDAYYWMRRSKVAAGLRKLMVGYAILAIGLATIGQRGLLLSPLALDDRLAAMPNPLALLHMTSIRATMPAMAHGISAALGMFCLLLLSDVLPCDLNSALTRRCRRVADGTFAIYLMHYPLMIAATSLGLLRSHAPLLDSVTLGTMVLLLIVVAKPLDRFRALLRRRMNHINLSPGKVLRHPGLASLKDACALLFTNFITRRKDVDTCSLSPSPKLESQVKIY